MSTSPSRSPVAALPFELQTTPEIRPFPYDSIPADSTRGTTIESFSSGNQECIRRLCCTREPRREPKGDRKDWPKPARLSKNSWRGSGPAWPPRWPQFTRDRASYFQKVEGEVVQLALGIARKILHREAQLDPLLLAGIVRVALEKIDGATGVDVAHSSAECRGVAALPEHAPGSGRSSGNRRRSRPAPGPLRAGDLDGHGRDWSGSAAQRN